MHTHTPAPLHRPIAPPAGSVADITDQPWAAELKKLRLDGCEHVQGVDDSETCCPDAKEDPSPRSSPPQHHFTPSPPSVAGSSDEFAKCAALEVLDIEDCVSLSPHRGCLWLKFAHPVTGWATCLFCQGQGEEADTSVAHPVPDKKTRPRRCT